MLLTRSPLANAGRAGLLNVLALAALCLPLPTRAQDPAPISTIKLSPAVRITPLEEEALSDSTLKLLHAMVGQPMALSKGQVQGAARIIAGPKDRVVFGAGDRIHVAGTDFVGQAPPQRDQRLRIFRDAGPLKDPETGAVLGQETQFLGNAIWVSASDLRPDTAGAENSSVRVPASLDIVSSQQEIKVGDRVLMAQLEPPETIRPHRPTQAVNARVLRLYGLDQKQASQNQIIAINKGRSDGIETGHLLSIVSRPTTVRDVGDPLGEAWLLPLERRGTVLVFLTSERFSYALISESLEGVQVGDFLAGP